MREVKETPKGLRGYVKGLRRARDSGLKLYHSENLLPGEVIVVEDTQMTAYSKGIYLHPINYFYLKYANDSTYRDGFTIASVQVENWLKTEWSYQFHLAENKIISTIYFAEQVALRNLDHNVLKSTRKQTARDYRADEIIRRNGFNPITLRLQSDYEKVYGPDARIMVNDEGRSIIQQSDLYTKYIDYTKYWTKEVITPEEARRNILGDHIVP